MFTGDELGAIFVSFDDLLKQSDYLVVAAPLTNETKGLFDDSVFDKMKKTSIFVNIARGQIVNTDSLVRALRNKKIFAAGLDVTDPEPLPPDHELFKLPNAGIITLFFLFVYFNNRLLLSLKYNSLNY